jgi:hypothetical protein
MGARPYFLPLLPCFFLLIFLYFNTFINYASVSYVYLKMLLRKTPFFLLLSLLILVPLLAYKVHWLIHSKKTRGVMAFEGQGNAGDQVRQDYSIIYFRCGKDTVWFNGLGNLRLPTGTIVPVRYQTNDPNDAKLDTFEGIWGDTVVYGGIPLTMLLVMFLHPKVVPRRSKVRLICKKPFVKLVYTGKWTEDLP